MNRAQIIALMGVFVGVIAGAYFWFLATNPGPVARILLRRGYEERGWTEERLAKRVRSLCTLGVVLALGAILLAIVKFVG
jgi:hypothetical protein